MPRQLLIIDDDRKLNRLLTGYLADFGFRVESVTRPTEGIARIRRDPPDLVVLDVMLPEMNGFEVCREIRSFSQVPVVMLTARGDLMDKVAGLELGADDYLPKPFEPRELVARIQSVLRRTANRETSGKRIFGRLAVDPEKRKALVDGRDAELSTNEFKALWLLVENAGTVMDRDAILQSLRGMDADAFNRSVDITMSRLRQKLGDDPKSPRRIKTIWGKGYLFVKEAW